MVLTKTERRIVVNLVLALLEKVVDTPTPSLAKTSKKRKRRSRADAAKLREKVQGAREAKKPVKIIAREFGVTPSYIYQIGSGTRH